MQRKIFAGSDMNVLTLLVAARQRVGRLDEARALMENAKRRLGATGQPVHEPEVFRFDAELVAAEARGAGRADAASRERVEVLLRSAVECAKHQGSLTLELRSMTKLARVCRGSKAREVRTKLAELYGSFTEGFDTADLLDARALLTRH